MQWEGYYEKHKNSKHKRHLIMKDEKENILFVQAYKNILIMLFLVFIYYAKS